MKYIELWNIRMKINPNYINKSINAIYSFETPISI